MDPYRFHIMWRRVNEDEFRDFFQTNDIYEAKDFAMRLAFDETNVSTSRTSSVTSVSGTSTRKFTKNNQLSFSPPLPILRAEVIFYGKAALPPRRHAGRSQLLLSPGERAGADQHVRHL